MPQICLPCEIHVNEEQSEFHWGGILDFRSFRVPLKHELYIFQND